MIEHIMHPSPHKSPLVASHSEEAVGLFSLLLSRAIAVLPIVRSPPQQTHCHILSPQPTGVPVPNLPGSFTEPLEPPQSNLALKIWLNLLK